jgi:uncharacterized protein YijF (DUF1287 family)
MTVIAAGLLAVGVARAQQPPPSAADRLVDAAVAQTRSRVTYDGSYRRIAYPGGDVPKSIGVCPDVVIRAYRRVGVDLQVKVHEDMKRAFRSYSQIWGIRPRSEHRSPAGSEPAGVLPPRGRGASCRARRRAVSGR